MDVSRSATVKWASNRRSMFAVTCSRLLPASLVAVSGEQLVDGERTRPAKYERGQGGEVQQIGLVARWTELRPRFGHRAQLDRTEPVWQVHCDRGHEQNRGQRHAHQWDPGAEEDRESAEELESDRHPRHEL